MALSDDWQQPCNKSAEMAGAMDQRQECTPELALELKDLSSKDVQLWSIAILVGIVLTVGFLTLIAPNLVWRSGPVQVDSRYLPQLFTGFIVLIGLFNLYLLDQKRRLNRTRDRLIRKLMVQETSNNELCDPLTKLFSRHYIDLLIPKETARVDRDGKSISFAFITASNLKSVVTKYGSVAGDHLLLVFSQLLKTTLRGSDIISRYSNEEFLVLLPDTASEQAGTALSRIQRAIERWNDTTVFPYKIEAQFGYAAYERGLSADEVISTARHSVGLTLHLPESCSYAHQPAIQ
jgi:diguanylate cyclase (GGDEF)-like protein